MVCMKSLYRVQGPLLRNRLLQWMMGNRVRRFERVRRVDQVMEVDEGETYVRHYIDGTSMRLMIPPKSMQWLDRLFVGS
jgi:hypothetical protein